MDDDFGFNPSVWGDISSESHPVPTAFTNTVPAPRVVPTSFDDFDDAFADDDDNIFGQAQPAAGGDDFDDFGDFDEGGGDTFEDSQFPEDSSSFDRPAETILLETEWQPLRLSPLPMSGKLSEQIQSVLAPLWENGTVYGAVRDGNIRQVEGVNQTLVSPDR